MPKGGKSWGISREVNAVGGDEFVMIIKTEWGKGMLRSFYGKIKQQTGEKRISANTWGVTQKGGG